MYELEIHRNRISELEKHCDAFEKRLSGLQEQQNFYMIMKKEYQKLNGIIKDNRFKPIVQTSNYKKDELLKLPLLKRSIIDIREAVQENKAFVEKLNEEKSNLEFQYNSMRENVSQLETESYNLRQQNQKLRNEKKKLQDDQKVVLQKTRAQLREVQEEKG